MFFQRRHPVGPPWYRVLWWTGAGAWGVFTLGAAPGSTAAITIGGLFLLMAGVAWY